MVSTSETQGETPSRVPLRICHQGSATPHSLLVNHAPPHSLLVNHAHPHSLLVNHAHPHPLLVSHAHLHSLLVNHAYLFNKCDASACQALKPLPFKYHKSCHYNEEEIATYANNRSTILRHLPGGGVPSGTELAVSDFTQKFDFKLLVTHKAAEGWDKEEEPEGWGLVARAPSFAWPSLPWFPPYM